MIAIEKAKATDAIEIKNLLRETWGQTYANVFSPEQIKKITSKWHDLDLLRTQINDKNRAFLVAKDEGKIVAMCNTDEITGDNINITRIHVLPAYQRKGIGSELIDEVIKLYPESKKIDLEVEKNNSKAIAFYIKKGFEKVRTKNFKVEGIEILCFVMEKSM